ncbi:hypothetical protein PQR71_06950 [Paraburkholderia fungorum]|uniref:hypothetical protein n=1 Tax=Paraburkholderia fungorum TaxID=134537 RepID=UPI0038BC3737
MTDYATKRSAVSAGIVISFVILGTGCARLQFNPTEQANSLTFFEVEPYLFVTTNSDCISTATAVGLPGKKRSVELKSGYGSADLSIALAAGMITSVGQKTDTKIPETLTAIGGLATAGVLLKGNDVVCDPTAKLYPIKDGKPDIDHPIVFPVNSKYVGRDGAVP